MSDFVWLASYPKSGNTWFRIFLSNFLGNNDVPADINGLDVDETASSRGLIDTALAMECSDLTEDELGWYRPQAFRELARRRQKTSYVKVHDAWTCSAEGEALFPSEVSRGAVYLLRNPLAVAVSFAHHSGVSVDETIDRMSREDYAMAGNPYRAEPALKQHMSTWSRHVLSWLDQTRILGELKAQELARGFHEKPVLAKEFFRQGCADGWRDALSEAQIERIIRDHRAVMKRMGYLE